MKHADIIRIYNKINIQDIRETELNVETCKRK